MMPSRTQNLRREYMTRGSGGDSGLQALLARDIPLFRPMTNGRLLRVSILVVFALVLACALYAAEKPKLTLDEFFNYVDILAVEVSPDGNSVVINTERADWDQSIFRRDLWLYRDDGHGGAGPTHASG